MSLPTHCEDCGKKLPSMFRRTRTGAICPPCSEKRQEKFKEDIKNWIENHRKKMNMQDIPFRVVEYCSQAFVNINNNTFGYNVPYEPTETKRIKISNLKDYGTTCGSVPNKFSSESIKFISKNTDVDFIIAEVVEEKTIQNMTIKWNETVEDKREEISDKFNDLVYGFGGSLRPDYMNYEGWDTFESE